VIKQILLSRLPDLIVEAILKQYTSMKENFFLGKHGPSGVDGGRFAEAVTRALEHICLGSWTPLDQKLDFDHSINAIMALPQVTQPDNLRIGIPRALRALYDVRNRRGAAHLADINPNYMDSAFSVACADWVLAELVREFSEVPHDEAQALVDGLVSRKVPVIQDIDGFLRTLRPEMTGPERIQLLLYYRGKQGAIEDELLAWTKNKFSKVKPLRKALSRLDDRDLVHRKPGDRWILTETGLIKAEEIMKSYQQKTA